MIAPEPGSRQAPPSPAATPPTTVAPLSDSEVLARFRDDLRAAGYDAAGVPQFLGPQANRALARGEMAPALRTTRDRSPLAVLVRLFLLGSTERRSDAESALPRTGADAAAAQGVLEIDGMQVRAALDIRPHADETAEYLVVSDLDSDVRSGPMRPDHVLGIGSASVTLARAVIRDPVERVLDLGTGCGIQALHLSTHAPQVVATDVNPRALALARATARLNGLSWDLRLGSSYEPVHGEQFDLIIANPPFVVGTGDRRFSYRDSGVAGDGFCRELVTKVRAHLRPGGTAQLLANWIVREDTDWRERVGEWVRTSACEAWVVQREVADPSQYVALWLNDSGESRDPAAAQLAERWLDYFAAERIAGIGMGSITLRRVDSGDPAITLDEIRDVDEELTGVEVAAFLRRRAWVGQTDDRQILDWRLELAPDVVLEQRAVAGDQGWATVLRMLHRPGGPGATLQLDEWGQALLGGCTGRVPLRVQIELLAVAHGLDARALATAVLPSIRVALIRGLLTVSD